MLLVELGRPSTENNKRFIRQCASQSPLVISGQKGYLHIEHATPEEVDHACNVLESQAKEMLRRAACIRSAAHEFQ